MTHNQQNIATKGEADGYPQLLRDVQHIVE